MHAWLKTLTTDTRRLNSLFFPAQIQLQLPNIFGGFRYKCLVMVDLWKTWKRNPHYQMDSDKLDEITTNVQKNFGPVCLPKTKSLGFSKKSSLGVRSPCLMIMNPLAFITRP